MSLVNATSAEYFEHFRESRITALHIPFVPHVDGMVTATSILFVIFFAIFMLSAGFFSVYSVAPTVRSRSPVMHSSGVSIQLPKASPSDVIVPCIFVQEEQSISNIRTAISIRKIKAAPQCHDEKVTSANICRASLIKPDKCCGDNAMKLTGTSTITA